MKIDEKWVAKAAGWKAMKEGRDLWRQGVVKQVKVQGNLTVGELSGGGKPLRVTVKIHSDVDLEIVCPKPACRRTGEVCGHAVAVLLASIHGIEEDISQEVGAVTVKSDEIIPPAVRVELPPNFPKGLPDGGLSLRLLGRDAAVDAGDMGLGKWLIQHAAGKVPPMLGLRGEQALGFLSTLQGHGHCYAGERQVKIQTGDVKIPMQLECDDDRFGISLCPKLREQGGVWYQAGMVWIWDENQAVLVRVEVAAVLNERQWLRLTEGLPVWVPVKNFIKELSSWQQVAAWVDDAALSKIPITVGEPTFQLQLAGSTHELEATLRAVYAPGFELVLGIFGNDEAAFPLEDPQRAGHWLDRNRELEDEAAGRLMACGFQLVDRQGGWSLKGDDAVLDFLCGTLPDLEQLWSVQSSGKLKSLKGNMVRVRPSFEIMGSGEDWLAFDYGFQTDDGREIPREAIQKMLASGRRTATSKNGKQVVMSGFDAALMESVLRDTDPRQEAGKYYVPKNQGAYLRRLRDYYQGAGKEQPVDRSLVENLPDILRATLRPYQEEGIVWLYQRCQEEGAALLADDMGLGKTLQTLAVLALRHAQQDGKRPSLVVCPTSLLGNWADEAARWTPELAVHVMHGSGRAEAWEQMQNVDFLITSYALLARDLQHYRALDLEVLVIDEASVIRNPDTQAAKALRQLPARARLALTGTPIENAVRDLWSLYSFLLPGYLGSREDFKQRYELALAGQQPDENAMRRLRLRVEPFMLRRTKAKVAKDLPQKLEQVMWCDPSPLQKKTYAEILRQGASKVDALEGGKARMQMLTVLLRLRQASCDLRLLGHDPADEALEVFSAKLAMLLELLEEAKRGGHRVLVFSQFTTMLGLIREALDKVGISYAYLDGGTRDRASEVKKFQQANGPDTFLISLKAGGYGLNLTAADTVVHFDPWWNPAVEAQATDRAYRIGQTRPVTVYKLITRGTVEEKILRLQEKKWGLIGAAIGDEAQPMMSGLSESDLRSLLA